MPDFSHLNQFEIGPEKVVEFPLYQLEGEPVLQVAPATESNKRYYNKLLQRSGGTARRIRAAGISAGLVAENRDNDRELYASYVLRGWRGIKERDGKEVPFSPAAALEFLQALPNWLFDQLREFCGDPSNFVDKGTKTPGEVEDSSGN